MGWANDARDALLIGEAATVRPRGGSMRGLVEDNQEVTLEPVDPASLEIGDVVFVRWKGGFLLHVIRQVTATDVQIGNNLGKINGWAPRTDVLGRMRR